MEVTITKDTRNKPQTKDGPVTITKDTRNKWRTAQIPEIIIDQGRSKPQNWAGPYWWNILGSK